MVFLPYENLQKNQMKFPNKSDRGYLILGWTGFVIVGSALFFTGEFLIRLFMESPWVFLALLLMPLVLMLVVQNEYIQGILVLVLFAFLAFIVSIWFGGVDPI